MKPIKTLVIMRNAVYCHRTTSKTGHLFLSTMNSVGINTRLTTRPSNAMYSISSTSNGILTKHHMLILLVILYGCETWSLTIKEERSLKVLENRVLRRIFGPKRDEITGEWRKLHNEELNDL